MRRLKGSRRLASTRSTEQVVRKTYIRRSVSRPQRKLTNDSDSFRTL